jgi:TolA-binding protein
MQHLRRGRPSKYGVAMSVSQRQSESRARKAAKKSDRTRRTLIARIIRRIRNSRGTIKVTAKTRGSRATEEKFQSMQEQLLNLRAQLEVLSIAEIQQYDQALSESHDRHGGHEEISGGGNVSPVGDVPPSDNLWVSSFQEDNPVCDPTLPPEMAEPNPEIKKDEAKISKAIKKIEELQKGNQCVFCGKTFGESHEIGLVRTHWMETFLAGRGSTGDRNDHYKWLREKLKADEDRESFQKRLATEGKKITRQITEDQVVELIKQIKEENPGLSNAEVASIAESRVRDMLHHGWKFGYAPEPTAPTYYRREFRDMKQ